jgi:hypothetical protein
MSERIRELAEQVGFYFDEYNEATNRKVELLAELIINDILAILADKKNFNKCTYTNFDLAQGQCITNELTNKIKEHFKDKQ